MFLDRGRIAGPATVRPSPRPSWSTLELHTRHGSRTPPTLYYSARQPPPATASAGCGSLTYTPCPGWMVVAAPGAGS